MHHEQHKTVFELLARAQLLDQFLAQQYRGTKRFGLEGCEALIVALNSIIERAGILGTEDVVMGMPHRGRINVLVRSSQMTSLLHWEGIGL